MNFEFIKYSDYVDSDFRDYVENHMTYDGGTDIGIIDYLFYDFADDKKDKDEWSYYHSKKLSDVKPEIENLLSKYNFKGALILKAFEKDFNDWKSFYDELDQLFNEILKKNIVE